MVDDKPPMPDARETGALRLGRRLAGAVLPERLLERNRAARKAGLFRAAGVAFIHVPRAGGTSTANALYGGHIGHFPLRDLLVAVPRDVLELPRFTIVRNPWERAVSAWRFARAGQGSGGQEASIANPARYRGPEFAEFDSFVGRFLMPADVDRLDPVFRTQAWYVEAGGARGLDHVGRLDDLPATVDWLTRTLGRDIAIGHHNRSEGDDWRTQYTPHLVDLVGRIYARDVEQFGYAF